MATKLIQESTLTNIANAIRAKTGKVDTMTPPEMPSEIGSISGGSSEADIAEILDGSVTSISNSIVTTLCNNALSSRASLVSASFENLTTIGQYAFDTNSNLETVEILKVTSIGTYAFRNCSKLKYIKVPINTGTIIATITNGTALLFADIGFGGNLSASPFGGAVNMKVLISRKTDGIVTLQNANIFNGTGMTGTDARIYVPQALIATYQTATNWATLYANNSNLFQPLEGSPYENPNYDPLAVLAQLAS